MVVIKHSNLPRNEKKGRVFLNCERTEKYKDKELKFNVEDTSEQRGSKSTGTK